MRLAYQLYKQGLVTQEDVEKSMVEFMNMEERTETMDKYLGMNREEYERFILWGLLDEEEHGDIL